MKQNSTRNSKIIHASPEEVYKAFTSAGALESWMAPGKMKGTVHHFDLKVGGGYEMSLFYPDSEKGSPGKTNAREDRFKTRFIQLVPFKKIVQSSVFISDNAAFAGQMIMEVDLRPVGNATEVIITFKDIPPGISPKDNEKGTSSSLEKLAEYIGTASRRFMD